MNYFKKNMESIQQVRPKLYQQIHEYKDRVNEVATLSVNSLISKDGNLYLTVTNNGIEYRMNSNYRPLEEASRWSKQYELVNVNVVLQVFGFGNGYCVRELMKKLRNDDHIIVVEPSYELFLHVLHEYDITDILDDIRVSLTITELDETMFYVIFVQYVQWLNLRSQIVCVHPQYDMCFEKEYNEYLAKLDENNYRTLVNRNTEAYFGRDMVKNTIYNYRYIPGSNYLLELKGKLPVDVPAIIVAAGPSLDINIEELKRAKGRAVIIATDTALRYLKRHGITADFAVTLDPLKPPSYFDNTDFEKIPLFCNSEANRDAVCKHKGRKIWISCHEFINTLYQDFGKVITLYNPGGSVATGAFSICRCLGFKTTILIGQDLAYKGEITHADGDICKVIDEENDNFYVEGIDGKPIKTRHDWYIYLKWFESAIIETKEIGKVIDATEGGAKIHGTEIMTLKEAIDLYCKEPIDIPHIIERLPVTFQEEDNILVYKYLKNAYEDILDLPSKADGIVTLCKKGLNELNKANRPWKKEQIGTQIVDMNRQISQKPVYTLIDSIIRHDVLKELENIVVINKDEEEGFKKTYESTKVIFTAVSKVAREIEPLLKEAVDEFEQNVRSE